MCLSDLLFSAPARVWNLRLLLLETIGVSTSLIITFPFGIPSDSYSISHFYLPLEVLLSTFGFILLHHVGFVRNWPIPGLAVVDLLCLLIEIIGIAAGFFFVSASNAESEVFHIFPSPLKFACIPLGLSLTLSIIFRTATIIRTNGRFYRQRFAFLGACMPSNPPYTPTAIFLNRSVARPLVRGESVVIIIARAIVLSCIAVGVPIFGIYATIISPIRAPVYTRSVATFSGDLGFPPGDITFGLGYDKFDSSTPHEDFSLNYVGVNAPMQIFNCSVTHNDPNIQQYIGFSTLVECPLPWTFHLISINFSIPAGYVVTVTLLQGTPTIASKNQIASDFHSVGLHVPINPIPLVSGSNLLGSLTWTRRETLSGFVVGAPTASRSVFIAEITGLQPYPPSNSTMSPASATLTLYQPYFYANKLQQDSLDVSPLSGLATFGGFWTFLNGAFALFFGANVLYFAFGRRPLSALGLAHIFQRRALTQRWHADFPTLRTEGGHPGSESAGVVAFIRERLIDIDQEPPLTTKNDLGAQHSASGRDDSVMSSAKARESQDYGHDLEDSPFINHGGSGWPRSGGD